MNKAKRQSAGKPKGLVQKIDAFHKTRVGYLTFGLTELGLAYAVAQRALVTGSLLVWALVAVLCTAFLQNVIYMMGSSKL